MGATAWGIGAGEIEPQADFRADRDAEGKWTARNSFQMLRGTWEDGTSAIFFKGALITDLFPALGAFWAFLELETFAVENRPGGVVSVDCTYTGFNSADYESDREVSYTLSGSRVERSIIHHPLYIWEMRADAEKVARIVIAQGLQGLWTVDPGQTISDVEIWFTYVPDRWKFEVFLEDPTVKWAQTIFLQGVKTFMAPTLQWTRETSSAGGLQDSDVENLGLTEYPPPPGVTPSVATGSKRPPGNPPQPFHGFHEWMLISLNSTRTAGTAATSQTWELSPPGGYHRFPGEIDGDGKPLERGKGIYNYDPAEIGRADA